MTRCYPLLVCIPAVVALSACSSEGDADPTGQNEANASERPYADGTPEAVGVLALLNDANTSLSLLDDDARLDRRAAENLLVHRDGADGSFGTADDDLFDTIDEVDAVSYVGPSALNRLAAYALANGWVPQGDDVLGTYDDVTFTVNDATAVLELVNTAEAQTLDVDAALDRRAVNSIVDARTIDSVLELSGLYFVGTSTLLKLRAFATQTSAGAEGSDCGATADCDATLRCEGIPYDGSPAIGKCIDNSNVPGEDVECSETVSCLEPLFCSGTTVYDGNGYCRKPWMQGTFVNNTAVSIPDGDANGATSTIVVYGQATVPEDIIVTLELDHPRPQDLVIRLISTNGSDSTLWDHDPNAGSEPSYALGIERDNYINGTFTLEITDTVSGQSGTLNGFSMWVSSRYD